MHIFKLEPHCTHCKLITLREVPRDRHPLQTQLICVSLFTTLLVIFSAWKGRQTHSGYLNSCSSPSLFISPDVYNQNINKLNTQMVWLLYSQGQFYIHSGKRWFKRCCSNRLLQRISLNYFLMHQRTFIEHLCYGLSVLCAPSKCIY